MRKGFLWAILPTAVLAVTGCSGKTPDSQTQETAQKAVQKAAETADVQQGSELSDAQSGGKAENGREEALTEADGETADSQAETSEVQGEEGEKTTENQEKETQESGRVRTVIGTLEELNTKQLTMLSDNGNELTFGVSDAEIDLPAGIRVGNLVSVEYTGKITKKGTKKASAVRIAGSADTVAVGETETAETETDTAEASESAGEQETEKAAVSGSKKTLQGALTDLTMSTITIKTDEGSEVTFRTIHVPIYFENGLTEGMSVRIVYRGSFAGDDAATDTVEVQKVESLKE